MTPAGTTHPCPNCESAVPADALFCPSCGLSAASSVLSDTLVGAGQSEETTPSYEVAPERLQAALGPDYQLGRLLGRGGYAEVFTVRDLRLSRELALKVLRPDLILSEQLVTRFRREALAVGGVQNAHIVPVYDVGESDGVLWLVMPLITGETLKSILTREGHLPVPEARRILLEAAEALQAAHEAGIVHRDIKPENLMIEGKSGRVMLMDFGIAKAMDAGNDHSLTGTGVIIGTPKYMSPEQAMGKHALSAASDQYSLAVVGYQMLSGRVPFEGENIREVMARQLFDEATPLSRLISDIPAEVSSTIHQALRKDPARRFASMNAFARSLRGEPVSPEEGGPVKRRSTRFAIPLIKGGWLAAAFWTVLVAGAAYGAARAGLFRGTLPPAALPAPGAGTQLAPPPAPTSSSQRRPATPPPPPSGRNTGRSPGVVASDSALAAAGTPVVPALNCTQAMERSEWTIAFDRCKAEADSGNSSAARRNLGILYADGKGVARDERLASVHLGLAAQHEELPDTQAVVLMARRYDAGLGLTVDRNRGAGFWEMAAEMGIPEAWPIIAARYATGDGRRKNEVAAVRWYQRAAQAGDVPSMVRLAELLDRGPGGGIKRDEVAATRWYNEAAERRDPEGEFQIGLRLLTGKGGFARDESAGLTWLRRAAAQGHGGASRELARRGG